ncbi:MAG TPA: cupredoxin domain-containing protein [Aliidongia sp.]|nr:cupredoxin domain-containing protein [Aliidongia sp.]
MIRFRVGLVALLMLAGCGGEPSSLDQGRQSAAPTIDWKAAEAITVRMSDFAFEPENLSLRAGRSVRLLLVNESGSEHNFSAPELFAGSSFGPASAAIDDGGVTVAAHQTAEVDLVPAKPGDYPLECTELLHSMFGMTGSIEVTAR